MSAACEIKCPSVATLKKTTASVAITVSSALLLASCATVTPLREEAPINRYVLPADATWQKLDTVAFRGKQDDIFFLNPDQGWYVNGAGKIYKTTDGGKTWVEKLSKPGTFFRTVGFVDDKLGFAGNIGIEYFPNVSDTTPLYQTTDGGDTWTPVAMIDGPTVKGLCAIDVLQTRFINSGVMEQRTVIHAGGRVGGPAFLMRSMDGGKSWKSIDLSAHTKMILDVKFFNENEGFIMGATDADAEKSSALILATKDGGTTWRKVYQSKRPWELTWKASFPSRAVGYVTIQSYNPDKTVSQRYVAKTTDGGETWTEIPLVNEHAVREFGVAFADDKLGWVGTTNGGYETTDGGATWKLVELGRAVNKIRVVKNGSGFVGYAIGVDVRKISVPGAAK
jgi:photosystem II stability/assembly factor-like uncharacterized protein